MRIGNLRLVLGLGALAALFAITGATANAYELKNVRVTSYGKAKKASTRSRKRPGRARIAAKKAFRSAKRATKAVKSRKPNRERRLAKRRGGKTSAAKSSRSARSSKRGPLNRLSIGGGDAPLGGI